MKRLVDNDNQNIVVDQKSQRGKRRQYNSKKKLVDDDNQNRHPSSTTTVKIVANMAFLSLKKGFKPLKMYIRMIR